jgi:formylmethanofuran dehydrogenase subunit E-like metal-binding protein
MDKKKSVNAVFQGPNKLKVVTTFKKEATGTVTSGDALINCPGDCDEQYILNAPVTLTATAGDGSAFVKWTGRPCKDELTNVCTFTMDKNATVKAIFQINPE